MKAALALALLAISLIAGCASRENPVQPGTSQAQNISPTPAGKGFSLSDGSQMAMTNGSSANTTPANHTAPSAQNSTKPVTGGSGGQIVDVGGSIPVNPGQGGSGN